MPAATKMKPMKIISFTPPFLRLLAKRYAQGKGNKVPENIFT